MFNMASPPCPGVHTKGFPSLLKVAHDGLRGEAGLPSTMADIQPQAFQRQQKNHPKVDG